jgi:hypothetical protein
MLIIVMNTPNARRPPRENAKSAKVTVVSEEFLASIEAALADPFPRLTDLDNIENVTRRLQARLDDLESH